MISSVSYFPLLLHHLKHSEKSTEIFLQAQSECQFGDIFDIAFIILTEQQKNEETSVKYT